MSPAAVSARRAVLACEALLVLDFCAWHATRFSAATAALIVCLGVLPWISIAPSLWRGDRRRHAWATLLTAPYLAYGMMEMLANAGARAFAAGLVLSAFALFVALTAFLRLSRPRVPASP